MKKIFLIFLSVLCVQQIFAWGKNGHLIVSQLADQYLTPKTRAAVQKILGDETFSEAGIWMDVVMNDKEYRHQDNWHYAYKDYTLEENALIKMGEFYELLKSTEASDHDKHLALRAIIHIAGDINVPLHCGYTKDKGGHKPKLKWEGSEESTNIHKVWDTDMIHMYQEDVSTYVDELQGKITEEEIKTWGTVDFKVWVNESQELLDQVYDFEGKVLKKEYYEQNIIVVNDRLSMSAVRLAFMLNSIFDPS